MEGEVRDAVCSPGDAHCSDDNALEGGAGREGSGGRDGTLERRCSA